MIRRLVCLAAVLPLLVACYDDPENIEPPVEPSATIALSESEVTIGSLGRYYTVGISDVAPDDSVVTAVPSDGWVEVDELLSSSLRIYVHPNTDERRREAEVLLTTACGGNVRLAVIQRSDADSDDNALSAGETLMVQGRVGFGYNLMYDYMDVKSATECVFDYNQLVLAEKDYGTIVAQDRRNRLDYTLHTAYSIAEMAENLMSEQTDGVKFLGLSKKVTKYKSVQTFESNKQSYGFAKISKTVATRYIDVGKIDALIREGRTDIFTSEFRSYYEAVLQDPSEGNVENLVRKYGTHVVTYADLGGRLEYTINFKAEQVSRDEMERTMKYKNGNMKDSDTQRRKEQLSNINSSMNVTVYGGSEETRKALQLASPTTDTNQQIPVALLAAWTNTIVNDPAHMANLTMSNCHLTPIWQLFPQEAPRNAVLAYILRMSENLVLSPEMRELLGISGYRKFKVDDLKPDGFGTGVKSTLVKVGYVNRIPMLEICNEYVPEIRGDKRVTIFYPIVAQRSNIRRGIFPGNGENPPCEVSFDDDGGCYVCQLEGYKYGDRIDSLYYIDGALYDSDMHVPVLEAKADIREQVLEYEETGSSRKGTFSLVKIGPYYWTRESVVAGSFYPANTNYNTLKRITRRDWAEHPYELVFNKYTVSPFGVEEEKWFFPSIKDINILLGYIGNNMKPLFPNQQSGFDISFDGYEIVTYKWLFITTLEAGYTFTDEPTRKETDVGALLYGKERNMDSFKLGQMLIIKPDYTFSINNKTTKSYSKIEDVTITHFGGTKEVKELEVQYSELFQIPVRYFRSHRFIYPNL